MADEEHVKILKQGVKVWNEWRAEHPDVTPDLTRAELYKADLRGADLYRAHLNGADLRGADLIRAILSRAHLNGANLYRADLRETRLLHADFTNATLTGACLYGTARDSWTIDEIICDYIFWDAEGKERTPKDRDFRPGEFEELYKSLPTFEYYFEQGFTPLDPLIMDQVVQAIHERQPEFDLTLKNFEVTGIPHATFTVLHKDYTEEALKEVTSGYETKLKVLEGQKDQLMQVIAMLGAGSIQIGNVGGNLTLQHIGQATAGGDIIGQDKVTTDVSGEVGQLAAGKDIEQK